MKKLGMVFVGILLASAALASTPTATAPKLPTAEAVLAELKAGNYRHVKGTYQHPHETMARRQELTGGQAPHAVVLACADSRVAPEIVFDQGLGDLFTIRVAGNIAPDAEVASMEYAVEHLHTPLIVVMGHQSCGAVGAAIAGGEAPGHLPTLIDAIKPAVDEAKTMKGDVSDNAVRINVEHVVDQLRGSKPLLAEAVESGKLRIVGAVYSLKTGAVTWLPEKSGATAKAHAHS
jgi:carbonic anhydrase